MAAAKKGRTKRSPLSAEVVRAKALALIEQEGLEELSIRKLGKALGVEAMAIYWYYPSKDALLDAVVDLMVSKMSVETVPRDGDWIEALRGLAHGYRALAHRYPKAFPLLATRRFATRSTFEFLESLFASAREQGLDDRTTARWFRLVSSYCSGVALDEIAGRNEPARPKEIAEAFPRLASVSSWLSPSHYDDIYEFGLEVLLGSLATEMNGARDSRPRKKAR